MVTFETLVPVHVTDSFLLVVLVAQCAMLAAETSSSSSVASSGMHLLEVVVLAFSSISSDFSLWKMIQQAILSHPNSQLNMKQTWIKSCNSGHQNASNLAICRWQWQQASHKMLNRKPKTESNSSMRSFNKVVAALLLFTQRFKSDPRLQNPKILFNRIY